MEPESLSSNGSYTLHISSIASWLGGVHNQSLLGSLTLEIIAWLLRPRGLVGPGIYTVPIVLLYISRFEPHLFNHSHLCQFASYCTLSFHSSRIFSFYLVLNNLTTFWKNCAQLRSVLRSFALITPKWYWAHQSTNICAQLRSFLPNLCFERNLAQYFPSNAFLP